MRECTQVVYFYFLVAKLENCSSIDVAPQKTAQVIKTINISRCH